MRNSDTSGRRLALSRRRRQPWWALSVDRTCFHLLYLLSIEREGRERLHARRLAVLGKQG